MAAGGRRIWSCRDPDGRGHQGPGPLWRVGQLDHLHDLPLHKVQNQRRPRCASTVRVRFEAVVEDPQLRQSWHQLNQIDPAPVVALSNLLLRNVVPASSDPRSNSCHVQFRTSQSHEPDTHLNPCRQCLLEKRGDGVSAGRRLECEVQAFGNRPFQQAFSSLPGGAVRCCSRQARICGEHPGSHFVGIEVVATGLPKHRAGYAGLAGTIGSGKHVDAGSWLRVSHVYAPQLPQPDPTLFQTPRKPSSFRGAPLMSASRQEAHRIHG